jgi:hypothetical protein
VSYTCRIGVICISNQTGCHGGWFREFFKRIRKLLLLLLRSSLLRRLRPRLSSEGCRSAPLARSARESRPYRNVADMVGSFRPDAARAMLGHL